MSKSGVKLTGRLAGFDPSAFASEFVSVEEVLDIKKAFDLFDYDGGGSIDPKGTSHFIQNSRSPSMLSELRPKPKPCGT